MGIQQGTFHFTRASKGFSVPSLYTSQAKSNFSSITVEADRTKPETLFALDILNLIALIPNLAFDVHGYQLKAVINKHNEINFGFVIDKDAPDADFVTKCIESEFNDELATMAEAGLVSNIAWCEDNKTILTDDKESIMSLAIQMAALMTRRDEELERRRGEKSKLSDILISSALSIQDHHFPEAKQNRAQNPIPAGAVGLGLLTIIHSFDGTNDFTINFQELDLEDIPILAYEISLGKNSDIPFSLRFRTLHELYDEFQAREDICPGVSFEMLPCETAFAVMVYDLKDIQPLLSSCYKDFNIGMRAIMGDTPMHISQEGVNTALQDVTRFQKRFTQSYKHN